MLGPSWQGSVFTLSLPEEWIDLVPMSNQTERQLAPPLAAQQHVLLVEDDPAVRNATRMLLKVEGYRNASPRSPGSAERRDRTYHLLITDYHLPETKSVPRYHSTAQQTRSTLKRYWLLAIPRPPSRAASDPCLRVASKPIKPTRC